MDDNVQGADDVAQAGDLLLWILVWSELAAFGILFAGFLVRSLLAPEAFALGQDHLRPALAAANTVILLTSGWQAARAARRAHRPESARGPLILAACGGFAFMAVKLYEYAGEAGFALSGEVSAFFELYFLLTGFHLLHVVFGSAVLLLVAWRPSRDNIHLIATLWHVIDLIWLVMFPLVYLV